MKRINLFFLSLLATLLVTTNAWGATCGTVVPGRVYTIKADLCDGQTDRYLRMNSSDNGVEFVTDAPTTDRYLWIVGTDGSLRNLCTKAKFVTNEGDTWSVSTTAKGYTLTGNVNVDGAVPIIYNSNVYLAIDKDGNKNHFTGKSALNTSSPYWTTNFIFEEVSYLPQPGYLYQLQFGIGSTSPASSFVYAYENTSDHKINFTKTEQTGANATFIVERNSDGTLSFKNLNGYYVKLRDANPWNGDAMTTTIADAKNKLYERSLRDYSNNYITSTYDKSNLVAIYNNSNYYFIVSTGDSPSGNRTSAPYLKDGYTSGTYFKKSTSWNAYTVICETSGGGIESLKNSNYRMLDGKIYIPSNATPSANDFTAKTISHKLAEFAFDNTAHTITITYSDAINVTYKYFYNEGDQEPIKQEVIQVKANSAYPASGINFPYGVSATMPTGNVGTEDVEKSITLTKNLAFEFTASETETDTKWYTWKMRSGYAHYSTTNKKFPETSSLGSTADYCFAFIGNAFDFQIMSANGEFLYTADGNQSMMTLKTTKAEGTHFSLYDTKASEIKYGNFFFQTLTTTNPKATINDVSSSLGIWAPEASVANDSRADVGSQITIEEVTDGYIYRVVFENPQEGSGVTYNETTITPTTEYKALKTVAPVSTLTLEVTQVEGYTGEVSSIEGNVITVKYTLNKSAEWEALDHAIIQAETLLPTLPATTTEGVWGTDPGYYNKAGVAALPQAIIDAKAVRDATYSTTEEEKAACGPAATTMTTALNAAKRIMPVVGKTYQLISAYPAFETHAEGDGKKKAIYSDGEGLRWQALSTSDKSMFWLVTAVDGDKVTFKNYNDNMYPTGFTTADQKIPVSTTENYCTITMYDEINNPGQFKIRSNGSNADFHAGNHGNGKSTNGNIMVYNASASSCSAWYIHEEAAPAFVNITYQVVKNETPFWSKTVEAAVGQPFPTIEAPNTFITLSGYPTGNVAEAGTHTLTYTVDSRIPQTFAAAGDVTKYYALDIHGNEGDYPLYGSSDSNNKNLRVKYTANARVASGNVNDYMNGAIENERYAWAFIGDVFNGVKLYNKGRNEYCVFDGAVDGQRDSYPATFDATSANATVFKFYAMTANADNEPMKSKGFALKNETASNPLNFLNHNSQAVSGWTAADGGSGFRIHEVNTTSFTTATQTVKASKYGTIIIPGYYAIPSGIKVYTCSSVEGNTLTLTEVTDIIHPNVPYIVKNTTENNIEVTYTNTTQVNSHEALVTSGLLTGTYNQLTSSTDTKVPAGSYILLTKNEKQGFYIVENGNEPTVPANRCYLTLSTSEPSAGTKAFFFDDEPTGISDIDVDTNDDKIYNLAGQRVNKLQKGINIVNGKKVLY